MGIDSITNGVQGIRDKLQILPIGTAVGIGGAAVGAGLVSAAVIGAVKSQKSKRNKSRSSRKRHSRIRHTKRGWKQDRARRSKEKWEVAYQKRKNHSSKRRGKVYYARKTGQPYIILSSGKAKFIKGKRRHR